MFRYGKKLFAALLVCAAAVSILFPAGTFASAGTSSSGDSAAAGVSSAAAETAVQPPAFCPEDCLVELHAGLDSRTDVYDADGRHLCSFVEYSGETYPLLYFRDTIRINNYDEGVVLNLRTGKTVAVFPGEEYEASVYNDWILAAKHEDSVLELYDVDGNLFATFDRTGEYQFWLIDGCPYILMQNGDSVDVTRCDPATGACEKIESECFQNADVWDFYSIAYFGENYLITGGGHYRVVTKDWEPIACGDGYDFDERDWLEDVASNDREIKTAYYFSEYAYEDGTTMINYRNTDLEIVLSLPEEEAWEKDIRCHNGMLTGLPCEALGGRVLTGFTSGETMRMTPYADTGDSLVIPSEDGTMSFTLPDGLQLNDVNSAYILAMDQNWDPHLFLKKDFQEIPFPKDSSIRLGENGFVATVPVNENFDYETILYNADRSKVLQSASVYYIAPWINGTWYCRTTVSDGIIDENGRWLLRRWNVRD